MGDPMGFSWRRRTEFDNPRWLDHCLTCCLMSPDSETHRRFCRFLTISRIPPSTQPPRLALAPVRICVPASCFNAPRDTLRRICSCVRSGTLDCPDVIFRKRMHCFKPASVPVRLPPPLSRLDSVAMCRRCRISTQFDCTDLVTGTKANLTDILN